MNSLTTSPSQHAFKASSKLLSASRPSKNNNDPDFRTTNPVIFPSLSPFSNFYKNKKQNEAWKRCPESSLEPVKKSKLNDGNCKVISQELEKTAPIPILPKIVVAAAAEKSDFRVPRLPKRLMEKNQLSALEVTPIRDFSNCGLGLADYQGSFAIKDSFIQKPKMKEEAGLKETLMIAQPVDVALNTETVKKVDQEEVVQSQGNFGNFHSGMDTSFMADLYEKLRLEYLLLQYNQSLNGCGVNLQESHMGKQETDVSVDDLIALSKDLFKEHVKKTEVDC